MRKPTEEDFRQSMEAAFPKLKNSPDYEITSPLDSQYNCIAHALGHSDAQWWPNKHWARKVSRKLELKNFESVFARENGYEITTDKTLEVGTEKIAIFAKDSIPTHAARQLENGKWTSKMGHLNHDISHRLADIEGGLYGNVVSIMKRKRT